jgi:hypothetical protein
MKTIKLGSTVVAALKLASCFGADLDLTAAVLAFVIALVDLAPGQRSDPNKSQTTRA